MNKDMEPQKSQTSVALSKNWTPNAELIRKIGLEIEQPASVVEAYLVGHLNNIRENSSVPELIRTLTELTEAYGVRSDIGKDVFVESAKFIIDKFGFIGIGEIKQAYRMWAAGELEVNAELYGGKFNVKHIGAILAAYAQKRKAAINAHKEYLSKAEEEKAAQNARNRLREKYEAEFESILNELRADSWHAVPHHLFITAYKKGFIKLTPEEIEDYKRRARVEAEKELFDEFEINPFCRRRLLADMTEQKIEDRAAAIAMKMALFEKIVCKNVKKVDK